MDLDDFGRVADAALQHIEALLSEWLPNGVRDGNEYCIGSRGGEAGKSMRIRVSGSKAGSWADFANMDSGGNDAGRDLISLYAYIEGITQGKACAAIAKRLGITLTDTRPNAGPRPSSSAPMPVPPAPAGKGGRVKKPRTEWIPLLPVPTDAPEPPKAHIKRGRPEATWHYRDQEGRLLGVVFRFRTSDGGKEVLPCVYAVHPDTGNKDWRWMHFAEPRPLYLPAPLREDFPVLIPEGEKCADAALAMLSDAWDVVSWPGGGKAVSKADWTPLAGKTVLLWPDTDAKRYKDNHPLAGEIRPEAEQPGWSAMAEIAALLEGLGCKVDVVDIPAPHEPHFGIDAGEPGHDGYDIADLIAAGAMRAEVEQWLTRRRPRPEEDVQADSTEGPPPWVDNVPPEGDPASNVVRIHPHLAAAEAGSSGASTPSAAGANGMTRREIREMMIGSGGGGVKGCRENVYVALQHDPLLKGLVALDQFSLLQLKRKDPPWPSQKGEWTEGDDFHLGIYLAKHYGLVIASIGDIEKAVAQAARENGFNPVIEYFEQCADGWDGTDRIKQAFTAYWGAPDSEYMQTVARMFFVGLVKRAYCPGVKHDNAPVFEGGQGAGKSTALAILGGEWFADTPFRMGEKDGYLSIQGILLYEIAELEQFNRSEVTAVKAFMSSQKDRFRAPYGRRMVNQDRRTVFAATTNEGQYFKDTTGNRRFWPVATGRLDTDGLRRDRDQLLGEAVHMMRAGEKWYPTPEEQSVLISPMQESREMWDEWSGRVWEYCEGINSDGSPSVKGPKARVTSRELLTAALGIEIGKIGQAKIETNRISNIMRKYGWKKVRETNGAREYYWHRPDTKEPATAAPVAAPAPAEITGEEEDDEPLPI